MTQLIGKSINFFKKKLLEFLSREPMEQYPHIIYDSESTEQGA
jgi:hypothetical protein